jgi:hypothetical protein
VEPTAMLTMNSRAVPDNYISMPFPMISEAAFVEQIMPHGMEPGKRNAR